MVNKQLRKMIICELATPSAARLLLYSSYVQRNIYVYTPALWCYPVLLQKSVWLRLSQEYAYIVNIVDLHWFTDTSHKSGSACCHQF
ncbi:conserved hypothetical protein, partial [Trichinella spiralis]|uniref:hypothetical protein n=1 Tax=Trichinella spiralis TaxID=6334 RepID=UPI0001EFC3EB